MKTKIAVVSTILVLIISGCNIFDNERNIEGEVFIVTRGGENITLGLVDIALIDRNDYPEAFNSALEYYNHGLAILKDDLFDLSEKLNELKDYEESIWEDVVAEAKTKNPDSQIRRESIQDFIRFNRAGRRWMLSERRQDQGASMFNWYRNIGAKSFDKYILALEAFIDQEDIVLKKYQEIEEYERGERLVNYISKQHSSVKTNSQGHFSTIIDDRNDYILVAMGSRNIGDKKELYYWRIPIEKGKDDINQLFLSNDNMITVHQFKTPI